MTLTVRVRVLGLELLHLYASTDAADETGYDHDVGATSIDGEPGGDTACGFVAPGVGWEL